jgi:hypothetical protein
MAHSFDIDMGQLIAAHVRAEFAAARDRINGDG